MRSKAQTQAASRCLQRVFELDTGELDFVSVTPWQMCWFIAKVAVPSQRRLQGKAPLLQQRDHVLLMPRLFRNETPRNPSNSQVNKETAAARKRRPIFTRRIPVRTRTAIVTKEEEGRRRGEEETQHSLQP